MGVAIPQIITEDRASGALVVDGGLRFGVGYLTRTPSSAGNQTTWTWSCWVKRNIFDGTRQTLIRCNSNNENHISIAESAQGNAEGIIIYGATGGPYSVTSAVLRDPSAWYHIVLAVDTTSATANDRYKVYINNVLQTSYYSRTNPNQNYTGGINSAALHSIGANPSGGELWKGSISQVYFIDGQALDPSYFGYTDPLTNTWRPKKFKPTATPNNGTTWSSSFTGSFLSGYPATNSFDGNLATETYADRPGTVTFTPSTPIQGIPGVWVMYNGSAATFSVNGTNVSSTLRSYIDARGGPQGGVIFYEFSNLTELSSLSFTGVSGGDYWRIAAIAINGVTLLDSDTTNIGKNGFYLPFDGSAPIGQDQSGRGNNWTPVNFGGSNTLEKATGALPILNTDGGGKVARVGVRTDSNSSSLVLALPLVGIKSDFSNAINSGTSNKTVTVNGDAVVSNAQSIFYGGSYYFDGNGDFLSITPTTDFNFGTSDFTVEFWAYTLSFSASAPYIRTFIDFRPETTNGNYLAIGADGSGNFYATLDTLNEVPGTFTSGENILNKWVHIAMCRQSGSVTLFVNGQSLGTKTANINSSASQVLIGKNVFGAAYSMHGYLQDIRMYKGLAKYTQNFIPASTDPDILPDTPSGVAYSSNVALVPSTDGAVSFDGSGDYLSLASTSDFAFGTGDFTIEYFISSKDTDFNVMNPASSTGSGYWGHLIQSSSFKWNDAYATTNLWEVSGAPILDGRWHHCAICRASGVTKVFFDGVSQSTTSGTFTDNTNYSGVDGWRIGGGGNLSDFLGFLSNVHVVKGTALYTSNFTPPSAPISSVANTKLLCCKSNSSATAFDVSPGTITANGNATATNFNPFTVNINTQRGQESGYATLNPLRSGMTLSNGNLKATSSSTYAACTATIGVSTGKFYYETLIEDAGGTAVAIGVGTKDTVPTTYLGAGTYDFGYNNTIIYGNNTNLQTGLPSLSTGDIVGVAMNLDNSVTTFYKNGVFVTTQSMTSGIEYYPALGDNSSGGQPILSANFGQKPFKFPPPAGFQPLALANTPRPSIVRPDQYVGIVTYAGTNAARSLITGFKPDLLWIKVRGATGGPVIVDSVRGASATLQTHATTQEQIDGDAVTSFNSNGFSLGSGFTIVNVNNSSPNYYVSWAWKAGGNSNTFNIDDVGYATASAAGLTAGTITPTGASVNTKSGFSIIGYTGTNANATISHGLRRVPDFIIAKSRDTGSWNWIVYHKSLGVSDYLALESTQGSDTRFANIWGTGHTTSVFGVRTGYSNNPNGERMVAYCWAEIPGFSKFGVCKGSVATAQPNFNFLGFKPAFVMVKRTDSTGNWTIWDSTRNTYNPSQKQLFPNTNGAEQDLSDDAIDIVSNGFVIRSSSSFTQTGSQNYIYAAFAESPSFNLYGGQANAR